MSTQGVELGPLEIQINSLIKSLEVRRNEIAELQQLWLRQQSELVRLSQDKDSQSSDVEKHKRQLTILSQKKIRTESERACLSVCFFKLFCSDNSVTYASTPVLHCTK